MATILAVSPHADDAVLSYGGGLAGAAAHGNRVIVYTVFAGLPSPPYSRAAVKMHTLWDLDGDPMRPRLAEDDRALAMLGVSGVHGPFLDAIYRRDERGRWLVRSGTGYRRRRVGTEAGLVGDVAAAIEGVVAEHRPDLIVTCSATGGHVDHVRARDAAVAAARRTGTTVRFWEDLPYAVKTDHLPPLPPGVSLGTAQVEPVSPAAWLAKAEAVACYASQHRMLAGRGRSIAAQLDGHALSRGGGGDHRRAEVVWDVTLT
jgi:LmbE family N-acetylglucosaminyl deacetylase